MMEAARAYRDVRGKPVGRTVAGVYAVNARRRSTAWQGHARLSVRRTALASNVAGTDAEAPVDRVRRMKHAKAEHAFPCLATRIAKVKAVVRTAAEAFVVPARSALSA
jgi:hypothetical protein